MKDLKLKISEINDVLQKRNKHLKKILPINFGVSLQQVSSDHVCCLVITYTPLSTITNKGVGSSLTCHAVLVYDARRIKVAQCCWIIVVNKFRNDISASSSRQRMGKRFNRHSSLGLILISFLLCWLIRALRTRPDRPLSLEKIVHKFSSWKDHRTIWAFPFWNRGALKFRARSDAI